MRHTLDQVKLRESAATCSEHKRAEEALRESEERYRTLFETMTQGVVYQDAEGHITSANPAAERILGLTLDQMQGRTSLDPRWRAIHEDGSDFPGETHPAMVALRTGEPVHQVVMGVFNPQRNGYVWINISAVPQFKPGERTPYQVYTTFEDITERKQAEEVLREKTAESDRFFSSAIDLLCIADTDGRFRRLNVEWEKTLGYTLDELEGQRFLDFVHPDDLADTRAAVATLQNGQSVLNFTNRYRCRDGSYRWIEWRSIPAGNLIYAAARDITARKEAEEALHRANERLQQQLAEIRALQDTLREQAIRDPLTGLFNRRYLQETLERELARAARESYPVSMVMIDVDHFKEVNDGFGHDAGDMVLQSLAAQLAQQTRRSDLVCHLGGDEFLLMLPRTVAETAYRRAEAWRRSFQLSKVAIVEAEIRATISLGVAAFPAHGTTSRELLAAADRAMYQAKAAGRNRTVVWQAQSVEHSAP